MREVAGITIFDNETEVIVAIQKLSQHARDKMLADLAWHVWQSGSKGREQVSRDYNIAKLISQPNR